MCTGFVLNALFFPYNLQRTKALISSYSALAQNPVPGDGDRKLGSELNSATRVLWCPEKENPGMARLGRYFVANQPLHVIQRGNNREPAFFHDSDYRQYCDWLAEAAQKCGCRVHAYVLMTNHVHLLVTPGDGEALPRAMQSLGRLYVRYINRTYRRTGTLWEGRYRACPVDSDEYFFSCCRYIELNPVRAGMVRHPKDYAWSSYRAHAEGKPDPLAIEPTIFRRLGAAGKERQRAYRNLFREPLEQSFLDGLRAATNGGWAFGNDRFRQKIAKAMGRRVTPLPAGRPRRETVSRSQLNLL